MQKKPSLSRLIGYALLSGLLFMLTPALGLADSAKNAYLPTRDAIILKKIRDRSLALKQERLKNPKDFREEVTLMHAWMSDFKFPVPKGMSVTPYDQNGLKGVWLEPAKAPKGRVMLYLHGGAYIMGTALSSGTTMPLAEAANLRTFSLDYPLGTEKPFPAALDNAVQAYQMLLELGYAPGKIVLAGDSAGGGLALAVMLKLRDDNIPLPAGAYLMSPWADLTGSQPSLQEKSEVDFLFVERDLSGAADIYAAGQDKKNPYISPLYGDLTGLPPLFIQAGSHEMILDDSLMLARKAALADVPVSLKVWPTYPHVFQAFDGLKAAQRALREGADFLNQALDGEVLY